MAHHPDLRRPAIAPLALALLLALPVAHAQDSGLGVDLHFGDTLDPSGGTALLGARFKAKVDVRGLVAAALAP